MLTFLRALIGRFVSPMPPVDTERTLVLVGHCGPDMFMIKSAVRSAVGDVPLETVNDATTLEPLLNADSVLLVNRVLDGAFGDSSDQSGVELIRAARARSNPPACLLISNYDDAQDAAVAAGARPGFGKQSLYDDRTVTILQDALTD